MTRGEKISVFINELNYIKDDNLNAFARELIANAEDYFFTVPASSSGKYHPQFSLGVGGLVRHTRCVAYFAMGAGESYNFDQHTTDLLVIAALAHDIKKQGHISNGHTVREHPLYGADYVIEMQNKFPNFITKEDAEKIAGAVRSHMGKWEGTREWVKDTTKELFPMPKDGFEQALQMADYVASRKYILSFQFDETEYTITENDVPTKEVIDPSKMSLFELENYVIPFGKHKGKTLRETKPTGYLEWMLKQVDFNNKETQDIVRAYYNKLQESVTSNGREKVKEENISYIEQTKMTQDEIDNLPF
jgi:uncharacterized protein (DUF3820 family)